MRVLRCAESRLAVPVADAVVGQLPDPVGLGEQQVGPGEPTEHHPDRGVRDEGDRQLPGRGTVDLPSAG